MDYYTTTSIVAIVLLLVILLWFWYVFSKAMPTAGYPGSKNACPDYWTFDASNNCVINNSVNSGKANLVNMPPSSMIKKNDTLYAINFSDPGWNQPIGAYLNVQSGCNLTAWSTANNVLWDGVSNLVQCASSVKSADPST